jgi:hypothetical protein
MSHTPGPWQAQELIPDDYIIKREGTYEIWTPDYDVATDVPGGGPFRKVEDAILAAAAPDLLEELILIVEGWDAIESNKIRTLSDWEKERREFTRAAIAAAQGGATG